MSVRLESFQYLPRGNDGWTSRLLHFGDMFTTVQGPNGSGKTPIMKGVMQGLGHEVELPPDILTRCESAQVTLNVDGRPVVLTRRLGPDFHITVLDGEDVQTYTNEAKYSERFLALLNAEAPRLTTKQNQPSELYANILLPVLWVDQDHGWTTDYWTPPNRNFIQDQRQEVIRFLLGLPARHPFRQRTDFDVAKETLERTEKTIEMQRFIVERLRQNEKLADNEEPRLAARQAELRRELNANTGAIEALRSATAFFDREIAALEAQRRQWIAQRETLTQRRGQLSLVLSELDGEEEILTANVQSTDLLRQFCASEGCQMFATSERSFGRSLLFLKDQIKDLKTSDRQLGKDAQLVEQEITAVENALSVKRAELEQAISGSPQAEILGKLGALTKELVEVELRLAKVQQFQAEQKKFERLLEKREQAVTAVAELRPGRGKTSGATEDARKLLSDAIQQWLTTLGTQNTQSAHFDENFVLHVDGAKFATTTYQSGSTRTRIVLAFHAALLDVSMALGGNHPGWLIFDAPKQHELSQTDFDAYSDRLVLLAGKHPQRIQVIFSAADLKTQFYPGDEKWVPGFTIDDKPRFLGPRDKEAEPPPVLAIS
jgi:hypothetical protein